MSKIKNLRQRRICLWQKKSKVQRQGFTLIEILIVVAIIGILASVVLVGLGPLQRQGRDARRISDLKQIQTGLELYFNKVGNYPAGDFAAMKSLVEGASIGVNQVPNDPANTKTYYYGTDGTEYVLGATLDDKENPVLTNGSKFPEVDTYSVLCGTPEVYCIQL